MFAETVSAEILPGALTLIALVVPTELLSGMLLGTSKAANVAVDGGGVGVGVGVGFGVGVGVGSGVPPDKPRVKDHEFNIPVS